ncbi:hypothetical protein FA13DRAFT_1730290 [Coprinellus micaceus]|uniref:Uncharacterized protein n=1 Tax=Coprinellus micaceus TaxID=71717 RepID=A0A4Y7TJ12_COPMI|nr:hypothetical protein FA13DRAFT_1730290 [Coprinellus micaceus]
MNQLVDSCGLPFETARFPVLAGSQRTFSIKCTAQGSSSHPLSTIHSCLSTTWRTLALYAGANVHPGSATVSRISSIPSRSRSRVQPEFVIVALGMLLYDPTIMTKPLRQKFLAEFPAIKNFFKLYPSWAIKADTLQALGACLKNKSYAPVPKDEVDMA